MREQPRVINAESMGTYGSEWQARGYAGCGRVSELIGSLTGRTAIVCGNAAGVFYELDFTLRKLKLPLEERVIFAVNDVGMYLDVVDHWVSLHSDNLGAWKSVRWLHHHAQEDTKYHSIDPRPFVDHVWDRLTPLFALSGYFAMQIAWIMGADRIVLCGCPGTATRRFFEWEARSDFGYGGGPANADTNVREQLTKEMARLPDFKAAVRSTNGWTRNFFGDL